MDFRKDEVDRAMTKTIGNRTLGAEPLGAQMAFDTTVLEAARGIGKSQPNSHNLNLRSID